MNKITRIVFILGLFLFLFPSIVQAESIEKYATKINVNKDGTIDITESILYDFGPSERHGIFRNIPELKINQDRKKYILDFNSFSVIDESNHPYQFTRSKEDNEITLKIGNPDQTITGLHVYNIGYTVKGALTYFSDHDELYWNITGNDWNVPISTSSAQILLPPETQTGKISANCFTGSSGSTAQNCTIEIQNNTITITSIQPLLINEGLSIVIGFPKGIVSVLEPKEYIAFWDTLIGKVLLVVLVCIGLLVAFFWYIFYPLQIIYKWYRYGRDPKAPLGVTSAWFDPPKTPTGRKLTPAETGTLIDETVDMQDIYATIVDLARRGYLKIREEKKGDFYLDKLEKTEDQLVLHEIKLLNESFGGKKSLHIKSASLVTEIDEVKKTIYEEMVTQKIFPENPNKIRTFYSFIGIIALTTGNIFLFLVAFIFGRSLPRKTELGAQLSNVAKSLKNFLSSQERQLEYQAKNQMFFEKLLPYAIAFGVESVWAERFKDITLKPPTWYQGYNNGTFNSYLFMHSLNSSFSSINKAATPKSSSSGFSSGFSGGSSGGGGGGGGGGSW